MHLGRIYRPIRRELKEIDGLLATVLKKSRNQSIARMGSFLLKSPGKRMRPALVLLSAKATSRKARDEQLIKIASAVELVHMASLLHDDVIDRSRLRHNQPSVNSTWGKEVAIALGDYLFSMAFELISDCANADIIRCLSSAARSMCEGELIQVCERDNLDLLKERYILIVSKKTASLFAASCQSGALISNSPQRLFDALQEYGLNFGIAFQIIDDYLDLVAEQKKLGKEPGQDIGVGELTLPVLNLLESAQESKRQEVKALLASRAEHLPQIKAMLYNSAAASKTKQTVAAYLQSAKEKINLLSASQYKESLLQLADFIMDRGFNGQGPY